MASKSRRKVGSGENEQAEYLKGRTHDREQLEALMEGRATDAAAEEDTVTQGRFTAAVPRKLSVIVEIWYAPNWCRSSGAEGNASRWNASRPSRARAPHTIGCGT